jgi:hypothetical protein
MYLLVLFQGECIGTSHLEVLDHHFGYAAGMFEPTPAFVPVQPLFAHSPVDIYWADLVGDYWEAPDDTITAFCQALDHLHLHVSRSDGVPVSIRVVTIWYDEAHQHWKLVVHADEATQFHRLAQVRYPDAARLFTDYTHFWPAEPEGAITHPAEIARAADIFQRKTKNNPILIGEPGEVRRRLLAEIVASLRQGAVSELIGWEIVELDGERLHPAQLADQARYTLFAIVWYASQRSPRTLFLIEYVDRLVRWAAPLLKPFLARGEMRLIGTATLADYQQDIERDAAIQRRMQEIVLDEYGTPR